MTVRGAMAVAASSLLVATGCDSAVAPTANGSSERVPARSWSAGDCDRTTNPDFGGREATDLVRTLGTQTVDRRFAMGRESNRFNIGLRNIFPLPANNDRMIREMEWLSGPCRLTIWSADTKGVWRAVLAMRWNAQTDF